MQRVSRSASVHTPVHITHCHTHIHSDTYKEQTMPVIEHYEKQGKVFEVDSSASIDVVYTHASEAVRKLFTK